MSLLDAAYDVEADDARWLETVCERSRPLIESAGAGVHAFFVDLTTTTPVLSAPLLRGGDRAWQKEWPAAWWKRFMLALDAKALGALMSFAPVSHATDLYMAARLQVPTLNELLQREKLFARNRPQLDNGFAYPDSLNLVAVDAGGKGLALVANRREAALAPPTQHQRTVLGSLCAHLASAARLRRRLRGDQSLLDQADAVVDARGKLVHLAPDDEAGAKRAVVEAAPQLDLLRKASSKRRPDAAETLSLWRALYAGRYSVLDVFSRDGKRYVVARRNAPRSPEAAAGLTEKELAVLALFARGHARDQIAYELGLSPTTVLSRLASTKQKLATDTREELLARGRALLGQGRT
jgi:DNA-binding NarL/FixJ family response regulator